MELKFVNNSCFKQLFQNLRPKVQHSKNRIFVTSHFGTLWGGGIHESLKKNYLNAEKFCSAPQIHGIFRQSGLFIKKETDHHLLLPIPPGALPVPLLDFHSPISFCIAFDHALLQPRPCEAVTIFAGSAPG